MRKVTKPAKSLFGALILTALMSIVAAKFLSDFAAASDLPPSASATSPSANFDPAALAGDARFMGAYKVTQINSKNGASVQDLCKEPNPSNSDCSQEVWAYSKENQLIMVKAVTSGDLINNNVSLFSLDGNCKTKGNLDNALENGIFSIGLCSASGASGSQPLGGTIGLAPSDPSLNTLASSDTLALPSTTSQGEIKISKNGISIHKYAKSSRWGGLFSTASYDNTTILEPMASSR